MIKTAEIEPVSYASKSTAQRGVQRFKDKHGITTEATFVIDAGDNGKFPVAVYFKAKAKAALVEAAREAGFVVTVGEAKAAEAPAPVAEAPAPKSKKIKAAEVASGVTVEPVAPELVNAFEAGKAEIVAARNERVAAEAGADEGADVRPRFLQAQNAEETGPETQGLCDTREEAVAKARALYGNEMTPDGDPPFMVKKCANGSWFWGKFDEDKLPIVERAMRKAKRSSATPETQAERAARAAQKAADKAFKTSGESRPDGLKPGTAAAKMVDAVLNPDGVTYQELLDLTGWGECRPALVKACERAGVELRLDKSQKPSRYFGTRAGAEAQAQAA